MSEAQFAEVTGLNAQQAVPYLQQANGDVQKAINLFYANPTLHTQQLPNTNGARGGAPNLPTPGG